MGIQEKIVERAKALLADGTVVGVWGWKKGELPGDRVPFLFTTPEELDAEFVYDCFCAANLSRYLNGRKAADGKVLALMKPCDTYSFNQMLGQHRVERDAVYILAIPTGDMVDPEKMRRAGIRKLKSAKQRGKEFVFDTADGEKTLPRDEVALEKCLACKSNTPVVFDEELVQVKNLGESPVRFAGVDNLEAMSPDERFAFWQGELARCLRCNACRNICPVCNCHTCVFDNPASAVDAKSNDQTFEEKMFHVIRAFHVAGRCTDCGECSRACPQGIPLHLLNRKFIKDINRLYGPFQAGEASDGVSPLTEYTTDDVEPCDVFHGGGN